jgi:hypothetical protein
VTDPPPTLALLGQYMASSFVTSGDAQGTTPVNDPTGAPPLIAPPQHG